MNKFTGKFFTGCLAAAFTVGVSAAVNAQTTPVPPPRAAPTARPSTGELPPRPAVWVAGGDSHERSIAVAPDVNVTLCVVQGNLRINGWQRNEVRVFVKNGSKISFKVREKGVKDDKPIWISATGYDPKMVNKAFPDCLWGETIEIDVPVEASIEVKGQETAALIDSVRKVWIKNIGGDISISKVKSGATAQTYEGDVTVEAAEGPLNLETTSGNITAFEVSPGEIGDRFRAKTSSGAISLQNVAHRQTEANSVSGSIFFNGEIRSGGSYSLTTTNGSIRMTLPSSTACQISAVYGFGNFTSEIPLKLETENISPGPIKKVVGKMGNGGDASVKLATNNGSIGIKKN